MKNENMSEWIEKARNIGLDYACLNQDKIKMYSDLENLGLPHPKQYIINEKEINSKKVSKLFENSEMFCRLIPKEKNILRPYKLGIKSRDELIDFCSNYDLNKYIINLIEDGNVTHTGVILAKNTYDDFETPNTCFVEIIRGSGPELMHGKKIPANGDVDIFTRSIHYVNSNLLKNNNKKSSQTTDANLTEFDELEKRLAFQALEYIGGPKHPWPGYYEFSVWDESTIMFRNYQSPNSAWVKNIKEVYIAGSVKSFLI